MADAQATIAALSTAQAQAATAALSTASTEIRALLAIERGASYRWNAAAPLGTPVFITYSFMDSLPSYETAADKSGFRPYTDAEKADARLALAEFSKVSGLTFLEVPDAGLGGDIRFGCHRFTGSEAAASGYS